MIRSLDWIWKPACSIALPVSRAWVVAAGERLDRLRWDVVEVGGRVAQALGERSADLEVEVAGRARARLPRTCA